MWQFVNPFLAHTGLNGLTSEITLSHFFLSWQKYLFTQPSATFFSPLSLPPSFPPCRCIAPALPFFPPLVKDSGLRPLDLFVYSAKRFFPIFIMFSNFIESFVLIADACALEYRFHGMRQIIEAEIIGNYVFVIFTKLPRKIWRISNLNSQEKLMWPSRLFSQTLPNLFCTYIGKSYIKNLFFYVLPFSHLFPCSRWKDKKKNFPPVIFRFTPCNL